AHIFGDERRSRQIGTGLSARRVAAVTEPALRRKQRRTGADLFSGIRLHGNGLRRRLSRGAGLRRRLWRLRRGRRRWRWRLAHGDQQNDQYQDQSPLPRITLINRKMIAITSRMWSTPPSVFFVTTPSSHRITRMTTI